MEHRFELNSDYIELNKLLKLLGLVESGGQANLVIENQEVQLNNKTELRKRAKLVKNDVVKFQNHIIIVE